ncbi:MAG TPA: cation:proton antiporter, partial [Gammaproteobacteria bacterium]|nr:cation:proton antiporter [Gammaproteobacteria bacterium]
MKDAKSLEGTVMHYFSLLPLQHNTLFLFGTLLLLGLVGGQLAKKTRILPVISGYMAIGFLMGPQAFNLITQQALNSTQIFVDISLGLILFDLGRHLDFSWLKHDLSLLYMSLAEALLSLLLVYFALHSVFRLDAIPSLLAGIIAIATSPAVVMMVANDLSAKGPVTKRALMLTSLNNFIALILFTIFLPLSKSTINSIPTFIFYSAYRLFGSLILGLIMLSITMLIGWLIGKHKENQFIMFVGAAILTIGSAYVLNLSIMLSLFILGAAARNLDHRHLLMEFDFGWLARIFFILLFATIGMRLHFSGIKPIIWAVLAFLAARMLGKLIGVLIFAKRSRITYKQALAIGMSLFPMAGVA